MRLTKSIATLAASFGVLTVGQSAMAQAGMTFSAADPIGTVVNITGGDTGSLIVERYLKYAELDSEPAQSQLYSLSEGDDLFLDDVVVTTTEDVTAQVEFYETTGSSCAISIPSFAKLSVTQTPCDEVPIDLEPIEIASYTGSSVAGPAGSGPGAAVFGVPAALGAVGVAAANAGEDDNGGGTPVSPS